MATEEVTAAAADGAAEAAAGASAGTAKAGTANKKVVRPKIDLDEEIRRANDLAAMSRKMLQAAKNVSRNNRKAKQRLIKKAGKLSPEDLERIAVLKRCGLYEEEGDAEEAGDASADGRSEAGDKKRSAGPSAAEIKRPKLSKSMETLTAANPILEEIGLGAFSSSSSSAASSASSAKGSTAGKKTGPLVLSSRARLVRAPMASQEAVDSQVDEDEQ